MYIHIYVYIHTHFFLECKDCIFKEKYNAYYKVWFHPFLKKYLFIHLAVLGLSCGMQDL